MLFIPKLRRAHASKHLTLRVPSKSIGFFVLPGARVPICVDEEDETNLLLEELLQDQLLEFPNEPIVQMPPAESEEDKTSSLSDLYNLMEKELQADESYYKKMSEEPMPPKNWQAMLLERVKEEKEKSKFEQTPEFEELVKKNEARTQFLDKVRGMEKHRRTSHTFGTDRSLGADRTFGFDRTFGSERNTGSIPNLVHIPNIGSLLSERLKTPDLRISAMFTKNSQEDLKDSKPKSKLWEEVAIQWKSNMSPERATKLSDDEIDEILKLAKATLNANQNTIKATEDNVEENRAKDKIEKTENVKPSYEKIINNKTTDEKILNQKSSNEKITYGATVNATTKNEKSAIEKPENEKPPNEKPANEKSSVVKSAIEKITEKLAMAKKEKESSNKAPKVTFLDPTPIVQLASSMRQKRSLEEIKYKLKQRSEARKAKLSEFFNRKKSWFRSKRAINMDLLKEESDRLEHRKAVEEMSSENKRESYLEEIDDVAKGAIKKLEPPKEVQKIYDNIAKYIEENRQKAPKLPKLDFSFLHPTKATTTTTKSIITAPEFDSEPSESLEYPPDAMYEDAAEAERPQHELQEDFGSQYQSVNRKIPTTKELWELQLLNNGGGAANIKLKDDVDALLSDERPMHSNVSIVLTEIES